MSNLAPLVTAAVCYSHCHFPGAVGTGAFQSLVALLVAGNYTTVTTESRKTHAHLGCQRAAWLM